MTPNEVNPQFADREAYPVDWNNIQPRVGAAYASRDGKAVLRGGYGKFYQSPTLSDTIDPYPGARECMAPAWWSTSPASVPDPGPAAGRLPTDPFLVNGPIVNRALLEQIFPADTLISQ